MSLLTGNGQIEYPVGADGITHPAIEASTCVEDRAAIPIIFLVTGLEIRGASRCFHLPRAPFCSIPRANVAHYYIAAK